jgi:hypothetical protein
MADTAPAFHREDEDQASEVGNAFAVLGRRFLRRPTTAQTKRIALECVAGALTMPVLVAAIQREIGCSRATAYRAVADAFADGTLGWMNTEEA